MPELLETKGNGYSEDEGHEYDGDGYDNLNVDSYFYHVAPILIQLPIHQHLHQSK